ncbi:MAG: hypothetical protein U0984_01260, partial [Prosthecobacter sp.]|nr:hypothetical protein [Prosthecobacter sp.]
MIARLSLLLTLVWAGSLCAAEATDPAATPAPTDFIRFVEDAKGAALQTGIGSYLSPEGAIVDLVGAVHIADKVYFDALNARFKSYDAVLYELVGRPISERDHVEAGDGEER